MQAGPSTGSAEVWLGVTILPGGGGGQGDLSSPREMACGVVWGPWRTCRSAGSCPEKPELFPGCFPGFLLQLPGPAYSLQGGKAPRRGPGPFPRALGGRPGARGLVSLESLTPETRQTGQTLPEVTFLPSPTGVAGRPIQRGQIEQMKIHDAQLNLNLSSKMKNFFFHIGMCHAIFGPCFYTNKMLIVLSRIYMQRAILYFIW